MVSWVVRDARNPEDSRIILPPGSRQLFEGTCTVTNGKNAGVFDQFYFCTMKAQLGRGQLELMK